MQQEKDKEDPQRDKVLGGMVGKDLRQNSVKRIVEILAKHENLFDCGALLWVEQQQRYQEQQQQQEYHKQQQQQEGALCF